MANTSDTEPLLIDTDDNINRPTAPPIEHGNFKFFELFWSTYCIFLFKKIKVILYTKHLDFHHTSISQSSVKPSAISTRPAQVVVWPAWPCL